MNNKWQRKFQFRDLYFVKFAQTGTVSVFSNEPRILRFFSTFYLNNEFGDHNILYIFDMSNR